MEESTEFCLYLSHQTGDYKEILSGKTENGKFDITVPYDGKYFIVLPNANLIGGKPCVETHGKPD